MKPKDFFEKYAPYAMDAQIKYGVPTSITLAQGALESNWGESGLTKKANNFFGIKDFPNDDFNGEQYVAYTTEYSATKGYYSLPQPFRKYSTPQGSFNDHANFLIKNKRYSSLFSFKQTDYISWANGLKKAGYATDPNYSNKLIGLITLYNLSSYDDKAIIKKKLNSAL